MERCSDREGITLRPAILPLVLGLILASAAPVLAEGVVPTHVQVDTPESVIATTESPELAVSTLCTTDPTAERKWLLRNLTAEALTVSWQLVEDVNQGGTVTIPPGGSTVVPAKPVDRKVTLRWSIAGEVKGTWPDWGSRCGEPEKVGPLTWQQRGGAKAPTRPAKPAPGRSLTWQGPTTQQAPTRPAKPAPGRSLTWQGAPPQAPTPEAVTKPPVQVTPLCARQPNERRWHIRNIGNTPLTLTFDLEGTQPGKLVLDAGAETDLTLNAANEPNRLHLYANGQLVVEFPSAYEPCTTQ
jgi:hypothetical protein